VWRGHIRLHYAIPSYLQLRVALESQDTMGSRTQWLLKIVVFGTRCLDCSVI
jgi:hypothetical protein